MTKHPPKARNAPSVDVPDQKKPEKSEVRAGQDPNKQHKEDFEQLLDDAVFRVKSKNTRGYSDG